MPLKACVSERKPSPIASIPSLIASAGMTGRAHDAVFQKDSQCVAGAFDLGCHRHQETGAFAGVDHLLRARGGGGKEPFVTMDSPKLRIQERPFKMNADAARADRRVFFELICGFNDLRRCVQHRFPGCSHHAGDEARRAVTCVRRAGDADRVALVAVEEILAGAVGMNVDQSGRDGAARRQRMIRRPVGREHSGNPPVLKG